MVPAPMFIVTNDDKSGIEKLEGRGCLLLKRETDFQGSHRQSVNRIFLPLIKNKCKEFTISTEMERSQPYA